MREKTTFIVVHKYKGYGKLVIRNLDKEDSMTIYPDDCVVIQNHMKTVIKITLLRFFIRYHSFSQELNEKITKMLGIECN